jgi:hypothetical protein
MKLWIGGEIIADVADAFREARKRVEQAINLGLSGKDYNIPISDWDCIVILRDDEEFKEITKYSEKSHSMDFRLKLSYEQFKKGDGMYREKMIFHLLQRSLEILKGKWLSGQGIDKLIDDIKSIGREQKWIE